MKFGQVDDIDEVDFSIPPDHPDTDKVLAKSRAKDLDVYVGCAKWSKKDLKNFYPKGTKNELEYYATQFNAIELNATFRKRYWAPQYQKWADATPTDSSSARSSGSLSRTSNDSTVSKNPSICLRKTRRISAKKWACHSFRCTTISHRRISIA